MSFEIGVYGDPKSRWHQQTLLSRHSSLRPRNWLSDNVTCNLKPMSLNPTSTLHDLLYSLLVIVPKRLPQRGAHQVHGSPSTSHVTQHPAAARLPCNCSVTLTCNASGERVWKLTSSERPTICALLWQNPAPLGCWVSPQAHSWNAAQALDLVNHSNLTSAQRSICASQSAAFGLHRARYPAETSGRRFGAAPAADLTRTVNTK